MRWALILFASLAQADKNQTIDSDKPLGTASGQAPRLAPLGSPIVARNIFCSSCGRGIAEPQWKPPFELLSTLVCPLDPSWSRALLRESPGGELRLYAPGDRIGKARLTKVTSQMVLLSAGADSWRLFLAASPPVAEPLPRNRCENSRCTLERAEVERMVARPELLAARAIATPEGFLLRLGPSSPLRKLGLTDGDRLRAIDGTPLDGMDAVLHLWPILRKASHFTVSILREGRPLTWAVSVD